MFPNCAKYADKLGEIVKSKDINVHFKHLIQSIDKNNRKVTFKNLANEGSVTVDYDFLHIVPPQTAPTFIGGLAAPNGFINVNAKTLRHNLYDNIFALGDAANLPTAKTAAGVFA